MPGINFRATAGYIANGSGETHSLGEAYPITRDGITFGWSSNIAANTRDRATNVDRRLAGVNFQGNAGGTTVDFTVDLPGPGTYDINLALGDAQGAQNTRCLIRDDTTTLATINGATAITQWLDATGVMREFSGGWVSGNVATRLTFATSKLVLRLGGHSSGTLSSAIAHVAWTQVITAQLSGNVTADDAAPSGGLSGGGASTLTGNVDLDPAAPAGTLASAQGTITTGPFRNRFTGQLLPNQSIPWVAALRMSDGQQVAVLTGRQTNGAAVLTVQSGALLAGVGYVLVAGDGVSTCGAEFYQAT